MSLVRNIIWFRRDLRIGDHPALLEAIKNSDEIVPLFILDKKQIEEAGLYFEQDEPITEKVIPTQSKKTLTERTKEFIDSCKTKQELKAWELMCKNNPELLEYYNNKLNNL